MLDKMKRVVACVAAATLVASFAPQVALAETNAAYWYNTSAVLTSPAAIDDTLMKTYGVRAGSAGPDFLGITNTNFDFSGAGSTAVEQYQGFSAQDLMGISGAGLAIWGTNVNEGYNPYYANLMYNTLTGGLATQATTWSANPESTSWGDSFGLNSYDADGASTINGLEYKPEIIFGANKRTSWGNFDPSSTTIGQYAASHADYNPTFVNNDATNVYTQIYTLGQLGAVADSLKAGTNLTTRYDGNSAVKSALNYEKALRGNLLYVASQIDAGKVKRKKVAYLYCVSGGTGYFFTPKASGLVNGDDTGRENSSASVSDQISGADANYAANNATIDLGYMGMLPFVTDTFDGGTSHPIVMLVEDIYKKNPAVAVDMSQSDALKDVDVIVYNTTTQTNLDGTSGGRNSSGVGTGSTQGQGGAMSLNDSSVRTWAAELGFKGDVVAGDDWGTSTNQGYGVVATTEEGMAPLLYCQRNYTCDKPARAAWAFAHVYPELYPNTDASYAYWVDKVYHVKTEWVGRVVKYMTNQSDSVIYTSDTARAMEQRFDAGLSWWLSTGSKKNAWLRYAYYNGSSRASYYDGSAASEEPKDSIGVFAPSSVWVSSASLTDFTKIATALEQASSALGGVTVSADGKDVDKSGKWASEATVQAMRDAVSSARAVADNAGSTQDEVDAAVASLNAAKQTFESSVKAGTKGVLPYAANGAAAGLGSSSSSSSSSGAGGNAKAGGNSGSGAASGGSSADQPPAKAVPAAQALKVTAKAKKVKYSKLKKKAQKVKGAVVVKGAKTALGYSITKAKKGKKSFKKDFKISKAGVITVKKGTKKGTYKVTVKVSAASTSAYQAASATKTVKIKVK